MSKTLKGVWFNNRILCPKCRVTVGEIENYGSDDQGYWFQARCPHCRAPVKWYKDFDLSAPQGFQIEGEQLSFFVETEKRKSKTISSKLTLGKPDNDTGKSSKNKRKRKRRLI